MKSFLLFVLILDQNGNESLKAVSEIQHKSLISCHVEKAQHDTSNQFLKFFCAHDAKNVKDIVKQAKKDF